MEPHRWHDAATDSCCCSGIHAGRRRRASIGANFAQIGTSPARTRCAMSIAFGQCAYPLQRQAHCQGLARTGWTVRPQSVPNRASARNRDNLADSDILRLELESIGASEISHTVSAGHIASPHAFSADLRHPRPRMYLTRLAGCTAGRRKTVTNDSSRAR